MAVVFTLLLGTVAFAATLPSAPSGVTKYVTMNFDGQDKLIAINDDTSYIYNNSTYLAVKGTCDLYTLTGGSWVKSVSQTNQAFWAVNVINTSTLQGTIPIYSNIDKTGFFFRTVTLPEVQKEQLGNLMTAFGGQLKVILPVGVALLAILLGINLVPRLVHLFL